MPDDETLSAYLDGELGTAETAEIEARLRWDAALAARLDAVLDVVVALRGLDQVEPPEGLTGRVLERLAHERAGTRVVAFPRRAWIVLASAAAVVAVVVIAGAGLISHSQGWDTGLAALGQRVEQAAQAPAEMRERSGAAGSAGSAGSPAVADAEAVLPSEAAARTYLSALLNASGERTGDAREAVATAGRFRSGVAPGACLEEVAPAGGPWAVVRVESVVYDHRPALAYVLRQDAPQRAEALVVDPATCAVRVTSTQ